MNPVVQKRLLSGSWRADGTGGNPLTDDDLRLDFNVQGALGNANDTSDAGLKSGNLASC